MNVTRLLSVCALLLCLMACGALAEGTYTVAGTAENDYTCLDFDGALPEDVREKFRGALNRIVNEGASGLICLIL